MIEKGSTVRAIRTWGYGSEVVVGTIDRDYLGEFDSHAALTIWTPTGNYMAVTIDSRFWEVAEK